MLLGPFFILYLLANELFGASEFTRLNILAHGSVDKFKARLVSKGYTQNEGHDYHSTFALITKMVTVRTLLVLTTIKGRDLHQMDTNNAFLHVDLVEEVYMKLSKGHHLYSTNAVCKLNKSTYALKQASRVWFKKLA